jgi:Zn-dependent M16 (insulinase) family peptidase
MELSVKLFLEFLTLVIFKFNLALGERGSRIALSFLTNDSKDLNECFALEILSRLLLSGQSSPMYKALIESNLASGFIASGYDNSTKISSFTFGAQGVRKSDLELVERTIKSVLKSVQDFDQSRVDSILHEIELSVKHVININLMSEIC